MTRFLKPVSEERKRIRQALKLWTGDALCAAEIAKLVGLPKTKRLYNVLGSACNDGELRRVDRGRYEWAGRGGGQP